MLILYSMCIGANLFAILNNKKSKFVVVLSVTIMLIIIAGNNYNPDYEAYQYFYNSGNFPASMEKGFIVCANFFRMLGLTYNQFVLIIALVCMTICTICIRQYTNYYHVVILLYMLYMIFLDTTQIRNMVMITFYTLGLVCLSRNRKILYIAIILLASLFHRSILLFLFFAYISPNKRISKTFMRIGMIAILVLCFFTFINGNRIPFIQVIVENVLGDLPDKQVYFNTVTKLGFLTSFACQFMNIFLTKISVDYIKNSELGEKWKKLSDVVWLAVLSSSFALPLTMMNSNFSRYFRVNNIVIYLLITLVLDNIRMQKKKYGRSYNTTLPLGYNRLISLPIYLFFVAFDIFLWIVLKQENGLVSDILNNNLLF